MQKNSLKGKAWVVTVDMGYGHQRATDPLRDLAYSGIICANKYQGIPKQDQKMWESSRSFYEFVSRFKRVPLLGNLVFDAFNYLQRIKPFYPKRDLSDNTLQLKEMYYLIHKHNWGKNLVEYLNQKNIPLVTSFFVPAFFAEEHNFINDIYCLICDADMARSWAPLDPEHSRINYFAPNRRVAERLRLYGIKEDHIYMTGFPLPKENLGGLDLPILKHDLGGRIFNLDPHKYFIKKYKNTLIKHLGAKNLHKPLNRPLTLTFAVGGAGAQRELGAALMASLYQLLMQGKISLYLIAGVRNEVCTYFLARIKELGLIKAYGKNLFIVYDTTKEKYFAKFNEVLRYTDVLWTKPSELTFYCGLGLPIIVSEPIGSQENFNERWLQSIGAGLKQEDVRYTNEWLMDWVNSGWLAEAALQGYLDAPKFGTYNIEQIISHKHYTSEKLQLL